MPDTVDTSQIRIDDTYSMSKKQTPTREHSLFVFKIGSDGKPTKDTQGWYTIGELIDTLAQTALDAEQGAIDAKTAVEEMKTPSDSSYFSSCSHW